ATVSASAGLCAPWPLVDGYAAPRGARALDERAGGLPLRPFVAAPARARGDPTAVPMTPTGPRTNPSITPIDRRIRSLWRRSCRDEAAIASPSLGSVLAGPMSSDKWIISRLAIEKLDEPGSFMLGRCVDPAVSIRGDGWNGSTTTTSSTS